MQSRSNKSSTATSTPAGIETALDNQLNVITPENISFQYRTAGPFRRLIAFFADMVIVTSAFIGIWLLLSLVYALLFGPLLNKLGWLAIKDLIEGTLQAIFAIGCFLTYWFYGVYCETRFNGRTLGKRMLQLRAISEDGRPVSVGQATARNFLRLADTFPLLYPSALIGQPIPNEPAILPTMLVGMISMILTKRFQRLGDIVAGTVVVSEEPQWAFGLVQHDDPRVAQLAELMPPGFVVSKSLAKTLALYADRRRYLSAPRVMEIASHLSNELIPVLQVPADTNADLLLCALYHRAFVSSRDSDTSNLLVSPSAPVLAAPVASAVPQPPF